MNENECTVSSLVAELLKNYYGFPQKYIRMDLLHEDMVARFEDEWKDTEWDAEMFVLPDKPEYDHYSLIFGAVEQHPKIFPLVKFAIGMVRTIDPELLDDDEVRHDDIYFDIVSEFTDWFIKKFN
jgi:hypothetical protein